MFDSAMDVIQEAYERQVAITSGLAEAIADVAPGLSGPGRDRLMGALRMACAQTEALTAMLDADEAADADV